MSLDGRSLRSKAVDLLNSLDFSWQHVTYKTLASVWVLFVFYLSWLLLPEVCAILHGCGNANGTGFGTAQRTLPDLEIVPSFAAQAAVPFHPSPTHLSVIRDGAFAGATSISEYVGFSVVGCVFRIGLFTISLIASMSIAYKLNQDTFHSHHARDLPSF